MASLKEVGERSMIHNVIKRIRRYPGLGPGDDAAVMRIGDEDVVISTDVITFRRHMPKGMSYERFGWMAAAVNLSDMAGMGARPVGFLASFLMPPDLDETALYAMVDGMEECLSEYDAFILGGDTKTGEGAICGTAVGVMEGRKPMTRSGARPGDVVAVTGTLGSAAAGYYAVINNDEAPLSRLALEAPIPRIEEGVILADSGASSCMDISDGLSSAVSEICARSGVGMDILWDSLPVGQEVERMTRYVSKERMMLDFGGEYELIFTMSKEDLKKLYETDLDFTVIGMVNDRNKAILIRDGTETEMYNDGYEHFKDRS